MTTATSLILLLLTFAALAAGGRTKISRELESKLSNNIGDEMCKLMVETHGYRCEEHKVTTKDGYILDMQRIPTGRSEAAKKKGPKPPVLLQHGLFNDGMIWLDMPPDEALGFIMADNGFDVWLANVRGTNCSSGHISLSPNDPEYWEWTWDELAAYDLPAMVEYVYSQTAQKLHYVGHSMGTLMALGAFSRHEVLDMVRSVALLCPIAYMTYIKSPIARAISDSFLAEAGYSLGIRKFAPIVAPSSKPVGQISVQTDGSKFWEAYSGTTCCINTSRSNLERVQLTSTKNIIHLSQMVRTGTIKMYDYENVWDNLKHYGEATPPAYDIASIPYQLPLFIGYGGKDLLADANDVHTLLEVLSGHDPDKLVVKYIEDYAHLDFVYGVNANQLVYNPIMDFIRLTL